VEKIQECKSTLAGHISSLSADEAEMMSFYLIQADHLNWAKVVKNQAALLQLVLKVKDKSTQSTELDKKDKEVNDKDKIWHQKQSLINQIIGIENQIRELI